jgi:hypothetical protein
MYPRKEKQMFNVKVDNYNIQFTFQHIRDIGYEIGISDVTRCILRVNGQEYNGVAACSIYDSFDKERGRKLSLKRALDEARKAQELPWNVRFFIWTRYQQRHVPNAEWTVYGDDPTPIASGTLDAQYEKPLNPVS